MKTRTTNAVLVFFILLGVIGTLAGCQEQRVTAPNENTAAPARLPGEDPYGHTPTQTTRTRK